MSEQQPTSSPVELPLVTTKQAALLTNRSQSWIQALIRRGDIRAVHVNPRLNLVDLNEVRGVILAAHERGAGRPRKKKSK